MGRQFLDEGDVQIAYQKLRIMKQGKGESLCNFVERIRSVGAFAAHDLNHPMIQQTLIDTLTGSIIDRNGARKVMKQSPAMFNRAVEICTLEQQTE